MSAVWSNPSPATLALMQSAPVQLFLSWNDLYAGAHMEIRATHSGRFLWRLCVTDSTDPAEFETLKTLAVLRYGLTLEEEKSKT